MTEIELLTDILTELRQIKQLLQTKRRPNKHPRQLEPLVARPSAPPELTPAQAEFLRQPLAVVDWGDKRVNVRVLNSFTREDNWQAQFGEQAVWRLRTVGELVQFTRDDLLRLPSLGLKAVQRIEAVLAEHDLRLGQ